MRIFLDANILFSAAKSDGAVRNLLRLLLAAGHEYWVDEYVAGEARRNISLKGKHAASELEALLERMHVSHAHIVPAPDDATRCLPDKDRPVLAAAIRLGCAALLTGDRTHFGAGYGRIFGGVRIYSPRSIAEELL